MLQESNMPKTSPLATSDSLKNSLAYTLIDKTLIQVDKIQDSIVPLEKPESSNAHSNYDLNYIEVSMDDNKNKNKQNPTNDELIELEFLSQPQPFKTLYTTNSPKSQLTTEQSMSSIPNDKQFQQQSNAIQNSGICRRVSGFDMVTWSSPPSGPLYLDRIESSELTTIPLEENKHYELPSSSSTIQDIGFIEGDSLATILLDMQTKNINNMPLSQNLKSNESLKMKNSKDPISCHKAPCQHGPLRGKKMR